MTRTPGQLALWSLVATFAIQIYTALVATATAVLAPAIAHDLAITPKWIGVFIGLVYAGAGLASLMCGTLIHRRGAIRVSQAGVLICAVGIGAIAAVPADAVVIAGGAALVIGAGYGVITPASSHVLARTTPAHRMGLVFSIKQTGVPAGAALGGAVLPLLALSLGWRVAFAALAIIGIGVALCAQPIRGSLDDDRQPSSRFTFAAVAEPLRIVFRSRPMLRLSMMAFTYTAVQLSLTSFMVVYLTESLHWSLVGAGFVLTAATTAGVVGRIAWGAWADRTGDPRKVLRLIGAIASMCALTFVFSSTQWSAWAITVVAMLFGATAVGWNGVMLAEVARLAPRGKAGAITGATGFVNLFGVVAGPPAFAALAGSAGGYPAAFGLLTLLSLTGAGLVTIRR